MFKLKYIPVIVLALLMMVLIALQSWTFYLGTTDVTFVRLLGENPYKEIKDISLRRYKKGVISPHLFTIQTEDENSVIRQLDRACAFDKIAVSGIPNEVKETDKEMLDVIEKSPYIYLSQRYDLTNPKEGRMCLLFRDKAYLYLFINGNL